MRTQGPFSNPFEGVATHFLNTSRLPSGERTVHGTLQQVRARLDDFDLPTVSAGVVHSRASDLDAVIVAAPKSRRWRLRARVGERVRWYEDPEEARS